MGVSRRSRAPAADVESASELRPAQLCNELLLALEAAEGRRKRRARNTTADSIGLELKRQLLEEIVQADPETEDFEGWLLQRCLSVGAAEGPVRAMAMSIWDEWRLAAATGDFRSWLARGAPSDDREPPSQDQERTNDR